MPQLFFGPKYVRFPIHLKDPMIPDPSGQLAELIVYTTSTRVDLYSHQILLAPFNSLNTQSTVLTNSSVMVASVVDGEWRWQPYQNLLNWVFIPYMSASVVECWSIGSCSSSGLCQGSWSQVSTFSCYSHCLPLTQSASEGYENNFQELVL